MPENTPTEIKQNRSTNGITNWMRLMLIILFSILALDNYQRFGVVIYPSQLLIMVLETIYNHSWLYGIMLLCVLQQMVQTFVIEKLLSLNRLSEQCGMVLHAANVFFVAIGFVVTVRSKRTSLAVIRTMTPTLVLPSMIKTWSYAYVNKTLRKKSIKKDDVEIPTYPSNVTVRNLVKYMMHTPVIQYKISYPDRSNSDLRSCIRGILLMFGLICLMSFVAMQFTFPELNLLKQKQLDVVDVVYCFFRIMVFIHVLWLLGYVLFYRLFHPTVALFTGMPYIVFEEDWWNASNMDEFWRRWNHSVYDAIKQTVMIPLVQQKHTKLTTKIVSFLIAGIVHEVMNTLPLGIYSGAGMFMTFTEIPLGYFSKYAAQKYGKEFGNTLIWVYFVVSHASSFIFVYLNYDL